MVCHDFILSAFCKPYLSFSDSKFVQFAIYYTLSLSFKTDKAPEDPELSPFRDRHEPAMQLADPFAAPKGALPVL